MVIMGHGNSSRRICPLAREKTVGLYYETSEKVATEISSPLMGEGACEGSQWWVRPILIIVVAEFPPPPPSPSHQGRGKLKAQKPFVEVSLSLNMGYKMY